MKLEQYKISIKDYIESLEKHVHFLNQITPPTFKTIEILSVNLEENIHYWNEKLQKIGIDEKSSVVYYLSFDGYNSDSILKSATERKNKKTKKNRLALPRINSDRKSNILYVGKCNNNFPTRLRYHLGLGGSSTYALNLKHWATEWDFMLHIAKIDFNNNKDEIQYLEHIETALHLSLQPLLGRSGH